LADLWRFLCVNSSDMKLRAAPFAPAHRASCIRLPYQNTLVHT